MPAVNFNGDGAPWDGGASANGADGAAAGEDADSPAAALPCAWEGTGDKGGGGGAPMIARGPGAKVVDSAADGVKYLCSNDRGGVAQQSF